MTKLFELNPALDRAALSQRFSETGRVQVRDVLTAETAHKILAVLGEATPWGLATGAGDENRQSFPAEEIDTPEEEHAVHAAAFHAERHTASGEYGFRFAHYPIPESPGPCEQLEILLGHLNSADFLDFVREVTGIEALQSADGQATHFAPNHYLGRHIDGHVGAGTDIAYVLNFAPPDWHPDWGGYLLFLDGDGDIVQGFRPRFNALNLFKVPQPHLVSYVPPFAPMGRMAVSGWLRS